MPPDPGEPTDEQSTAPRTQPASSMQAGPSHLAPQGEGGGLGTSHCAPRTDTVRSRLHAPVVCSRVWVPWNANLSLGMLLPDFILVRSYPGSDLIGIPGDFA